MGNLLNQLETAAEPVLEPNMYVGEREHCTLRREGSFDDQDDLASVTTSRTNVGGHKACNDEEMFGDFDDNHSQFELFPNISVLRKNSVSLQ